MKKILFAVLAIVFPVIVMAQCPVPTSVTATVTFKRNSTFPTLDGGFTVDAEGHTVKFSRGNLQYKASTGTWQFAAHQYDIIGADNQYISSSYTGWIDLFGWATNGNNNGGHWQPYDASTEDTYGSSIGGGASLDATSDWGRNMGVGWRTLTEAEWAYLLDTRASGATVEGVSNARYTHIAITIDANTITGLLLFPDGYNQGTPVGVSWSAAHINQHETNYAASCTEEGWITLEDAGCVFLPYAGWREGTTVSNVGSVGFYWVATARIGTTAVALHIPSTNALFGYGRHFGYSVRLVHQ